MEEEKVINTFAKNVKDDDTIDLLELAHVLLRKWYVLVISFVIGAFIAAAGTMFLITPQYEATSMIYVYSKTTSITSLADLQVSSQLTVDFQIVATTREVMESVIDELGLDMTYTQLKNSVEISNPANSHILKITVTNPSPTLAAKISNTLATELRGRIADVMNTDMPSAVTNAYVPTSPSSPHIVKNTAVGGMALMMLLAAYYIVAYLMDDTIKTEDDVRKYLGLNTIASIPMSRSKKNSSAA